MHWRNIALCKERERERKGDKVSVQLGRCDATDVTVWPWEFQQIQVTLVTSERHLPNIQTG